MRLWPILVAGLSLSFVTSIEALQRMDGPAQTRRDEFTWRFYRQFTSADGLPHHSIFALLQGPDGYVYAGTEQGLSRYDGVRWESVVLPTTEVPHVWSLYADGNAGIVIGTRQFGAWRLDLNTQAMEALQGLTPNADVLDLMPADAGRYFVASNADLQWCRGVQCEPYPATRGMPVYRVLASRFRNQPVLWLGLDGQGVRRINDPYGKAQLDDLHLTKADGLPNNYVRALESWGGQHQDDLWIGTGRGIARFDGERVITYSAKSGFPVAMVFDFQAAASINGTPQLYAAIRPSGGLATFRDDGSWLLQDARNGVPSNELHSLMISDIGSHRRSLWLGTYDAGVARRDPGQFALLDERIGLASRFAHGIGTARFFDGIEQLWVGTTQGGWRWHQGQWHSILPDAYSDRVLRDVARTDDLLWFSTDRQLLSMRANGHTQEFNVDNSALPAVGSNEILALKDDLGESIVVATGHGMARWRSRDGLVRVDLPQATPEHEGVQALTASSDRRRAYVAADAGLFVVENDAVTPMTLDCLKDFNFTDALVHQHAGEDYLWLANRSGVFQIPTRTPTQCRQRVDSGDLGLIGGMVIDRDERLFLFGSRATQRLAAYGPDQQTLERFDRADGLLIPQLRSGRNLLVESENRLYAATALGLMGFEPEPRLPPTQNPQLLLKRVWRASNESMQEGELLPFSHGFVAFEFRLLHFEREHRIRYRSELKGLADSANAWSAEPHRRFERLPDGDYEFTVWAMDANGVEHGPLRFAFHVDAPWWRQWWALLGFISALGFLMWQVARWRARASERRARELARDVAQRTQELAQANAQLELASLTDPLTGLGNRRHFALATDGELARAKRHFEQHDRHSHLLLLICDLDRFKHINDTWGHAAGDAVLVECARRLRALIRESDVIARFGGEEFVLLLRDIEPADIESLLQRILRDIAEQSVTFDSQAISITTSIGAVQLPDPRVTESLEQALQLADQALYRAKNQGRNRACLVNSIDAETECEPIVGTTA